MLTSAQQATLKTAILSDSNLPALVAAADDAGVASYYNATASPDFWVWKSGLTKEDVYGVTTGDNTSWNWSAFILRSQAERDAWREMFSGSGLINPSLANVRQGVADIFSGSTNNAPQQRAHLIDIARRKANRLERLFATGGDGSAATPATMTVEGTISYADISLILRG